MASVHREVEHKYEPDDGSALPSFGSLPGVAEVEPPVDQDLEAVYFDTGDLALAAAGVTMRRRTGGDDAGWHLKLPAGDGARDEVRLPLGRATRTVPRSLREAVRVHVRDQPLSAVATIRTHRSMRRLLDCDGRVLAQVCDDTVTAHTPAPADTGQMTAWREWEVELVEGRADLLEAADALLHDAGVPRSAGPSKLARVLGDRVPEPAAVLLVGHDRPAGEVVRARLCQQVAELKHRDPQVRRDVPDGVHQMRVALRRLRSALATFRPLLDRQVTDPLREEMKWIAGVLGEARDAEVMHARLRALITEQPRELVIGPVLRRVDHEMRLMYRESLAEALEAMGSQRYFTLLDDLDGLVADPPWTPLAQEPANPLLRDRVHRDFKRLRRRVRAADEASSRTLRDERLHEVRKAAKRARYAAETLIPLYGRDAAHFATATKRIQSVLGEHHDAVVAQPWLRQLGVRAYLDGENAFTYGRLHALELGVADRTEAQYERAWKKARRPKVRRWLR